MLLGNARKDFMLSSQMAKAVGGVTDVPLKVVLPVAT